VIVTNAHVAAFSPLAVELWDGTRAPARLDLCDTVRDIAILRVSLFDLPAAQLADSDQLRVGELVIAIGNPLGFIGALTTGVVHAVGRRCSFSCWNGKVELYRGVRGDHCNCPPKSRDKIEVPKYLAGCRLQLADSARRQNVLGDVPKTSVFETCNQANAITVRKSLLRDFNPTAR
jgi:hypothetical protein